MARWATWCYGEPSRLQYGPATLQSCVGVQQGDPLGPLLFAAAVHRLALDLKAGPLDLSMFYLDDGLLAGDIGPVANALHHIQQRAAELGPHLNLQKSEVVAVGAIPDGAFPGPLPAALCATPDGASRVVRDFEFLGAPVGSDAFLDGHTSRRVESATALLDALGALADPQVALRLLRSSAGFCRMAYSMRCSPPTAQQTAFAGFDSLVHRCFSSFTGLHLTDEQWQQATRGLRHAGLGLRSVHSHAPAAFLASLGGCAHKCQLPQAAHVTLSAALGKRQADLSHLLDAAGWEAQLASSSAMAKAGLLSEAEPGGRAFLTALPAGRTRMEPAHFVSEVRARLGVPDASHDAWTLCWTGIRSTPACVWPVASATRDTTACAILCTAGLRRPASNQRGNELGFCCRRALMMLHRPGADLLTCTCLPSMGGQPHLTSP